jgi:DNA-binding winged helix-turn-helix (wHTH) protein
MVHAFLDFELDEELFELRSRGEVIATQSRVFAMIAYLLHARDRVVGKAELMKALWKGNVVSETAISQVVMLARKALGDEGESQRVIKTVRGRGFRFVAPVHSVNERRSSVEVRLSDAVQGAARSEPRALLIGRQREMRELWERLSEAENGHGSLVLLAGEPGIGKTTLAEELAAQAAERGIEVLWGRAWEEGGAPPFWPWIQVLRGLLQRGDAEHLCSFLGEHAAELLPLLPELAQAAGRQPELPSLLPFAEDFDASRARFRQFDAMSRLLRRACGRAPAGQTRPEAQRPRLIILDDLHAADEASIQLTRFLLPDLPALALLIVGTYRDLEGAGKTALASLAESSAHSTLRLHGLAPADVSALLAQRLGSASPPRWASALHRLSEGNPLLLSELCRRFDATDPGPVVEFSELADFALPERIASAVRRHLAELPAATHELLSSAAALGREFSLPLLSALYARPESDLLEILSPALRQGVVRPAGNTVGRLIFSHAVVCNTVYAQLSLQARFELHRKLGELLEQSSPPGQLPLYDIAHHFFLAASGGCRRKAIDYSQRAAMQAYAMMAYETAAGLYERALQLAALEPIEHALWHELLCGAGKAWSQAGELERASARFDRAASLARSEGDAERFAWAVVLCASARRGTMLYDRARQEQLREALALLPPGDSEIKALVLSGSTLGLRSGDSLSERQNATLAAVEMARRLGNKHVLQWTLNARHLVLWGAARPEAMLEIANELIELGREMQDFETLLDGLLWRIVDNGELGDLRASLRDQQEYQLEAERLGNPWHRYMAMGCGSFGAAELGDFARARESSAHMLALGLRLHDPLAEPFHVLRRLFLELHQGTDSTSSECDEPPASMPPDYRPFWALHWAAHGQPERARSVLEHVLTQERDQLLLDALRKQTLAAMAQVCAWLGEGWAAEELYQLLLPSAGLRLLLQACVDMGPVDYYLGLLAQLRGERELARAHLARALPACEPSRPLALQVKCAYGRLLAEDRNPDARPLLAEVGEAAGQLGMVRLQEQAHAALSCLLRPELAAL